jgi:hypothetical protein
MELQMSDGSGTAGLRQFISNHSAFDDSARRINTLTGFTRERCCICTLALARLGWKHGAAGRLNLLNSEQESECAAGKWRLGWGQLLTSLHRAGKCILNNRREPDESSTGHLWLQQKTSWYFLTCWRLLG